MPHIGFIYEARMDMMESSGHWHSDLNVKAVIAAFNQEKALVGAFSVIVQLHRLIDLRHCSILTTTATIWTLNGCAGNEDMALQTATNSPEQETIFSPINIFTADVCRLTTH